MFDTLSSQYYYVLQSMYFSEILDEGEEVELLTHGPFTVSAICGEMNGEPEVSELLLLVSLSS